MWNGQTSISNNMGINEVFILGETPDVEAN